MKSRLFSLIKLVVSAGLLALLFNLFDFSESWAALRRMHLGYLAAAWVLFQFTLLLRSVRWRLLLNALHIGVPLGRLIYLYYVGIFFNTFLPSGFGGDAVKMVELARYSRQSSAAVGTVLVDRLTGIIVLFVMGLLAWPFAYSALPQREAMFLLVASAGGLLASWLLFQRRLVAPVLHRLPRKVAAKMETLYDAVHTCGTGALWQAIGVSVVFNLVLFAISALIALALDVQVPFLYFVVFMPLLSLSMLLPSVGALGTREGAYVLLFGIAGVAEPSAIAMSLSFYLLNVLTGLVGIVLYAFEALVGLRAAEAPEQHN